MRQKKYRHLFLIVGLVVLGLSFPSYNFIREKIGFNGNDQKSTNQQKFNWKDVRKRIEVDKSSADNLNQLSNIVSNSSTLVIQEDELDEVVEILKSSKDPEIKLSLLRILSTKFSGQKTSLMNFFKAVAKSDDQLLAPVALQALVSAETSKKLGNGNRDQWETWQWSDDVKSLLEESVNQNMYKLSEIAGSRFGSLMLLNLAKRYPSSEFAKGAKEYRSFIGEEPYFGAYFNLPSNKIPPELRLPFNIEKELAFWPDFIKRYPGHPATDDAMYRVARAYEIQQDYKNAILWYYKTAQSPDGSLSARAESRALLLIDLTSTSDLLKNLIGSQVDRRLGSLFEYSQAVLLIRENRLPEAISSLEIFVNKYQNTVIKGISSGRDGVYIGSNSHFWENVNRQIANLKELERIRQKELTDERLYAEGAFWFENELTAYNYLWRGKQFSAVNKLPSEWKGSDTAIQLSLSYETVELVNKNYRSQNGYLMSLKLLRQLLSQYPSSSRAENSKYSIVLNYYWLLREQRTFSQRQGLEWRKEVIKNAHEFVEQFPQSSMADDALLTIGELGGSLEAVQALEKLFKEYPNSDRKKSAGILLAQNKDSLKIAMADSTKGDYIVAVGAQLDEVKGGWFNWGAKVFIKGIVPNSPAERAGLLPQDIILRADGEEVFSSIDVRAKIRSHNPGETVRFEIERSGKRLTIDATTELVKP